MCCRTKIVEGGGVVLPLLFFFAFLSIWKFVFLWGFEEWWYGLFLNLLGYICGLRFQRKMSKAFARRPKETKKWLLQTQNNPRWKKITKITKNKWKWRKWMKRYGGGDFAKPFVQIKCPKKEGRECRKFRSQFVQNKQKQSKASKSVSIKHDICLKNMGKQNLPPLHDWRLPDKKMHKKSADARWRWQKKRSNSKLNLPRKKDLGGKIDTFQT